MHKELEQVFHHGLHKFKELPPPFIVREIPALDIKERKNPRATQRGMEIGKRDAGHCLFSSAPDRPTLPEREARDLCGGKNSWNAGIEAGDSKT
jgi:hypothetical protein